MGLETILIITAIAFVVIIGILLMITKFYRKVEQGRVLIVNKMGKDAEVYFTGAMVLPIVHKAEVMDISLKTIEVDRRGREGLICKDNIRADIKVTFFVRVNKIKEDVLKVAQAVGCARASDQDTVEELFGAKFSEALKTVGKQLDFEELYQRREVFKDEIIKVIGTDLNGYILEDAAIDYVEQTPLASHDPANILDARGIRKITEITTGQNILTNDLKQTERKEIRAQNVDADQKIFELDRQRADAEAKQKREIATVMAREAAETHRVQAEEKAKADRAKIKAEEEVAIDEENKVRQVSVAAKNRERVVAVEHERVEKDRALEAITREREVELQRIDKEKALEVERKNIAEVVRDRIAVQKNVAEEEERIKDLRALADANRTKDVVRITAEGQAQEKLVKEIKAAEASEEVAKFEARERLTRANAALEATDKEAQAKIRLAEGVQAEQAAPGLATAKVKEADALATEKQGLAGVRVKEADANASEKVGLAEVRVKEANAEAIQKEGLAEAEVARQKLLAEAAGVQEAGLAEVRVKEADAAVIEKRGLAEATALEKRAFAEAAGIKEKLTAEAAGLADKAEAMKALDGVGKEHEEFRLQLEKAKEVELASIEVRREIAEAQARVLAEAMANTKINIVGGDGQFFQNFIGAVGFGKSLDGALDNSDALKAVAQRYVDGDASLVDDVKDVLAKRGSAPASLSAALGSMMAKAGPGDRSKLEALLAKAKELGVDGRLGG
jgi:uncharacterized membrane protein YqiK